MQEKNPNTPTRRPRKQRSQTAQKGRHFAVLVVEDRFQIRWSALDDVENCRF